jgi:hypothetical protein
VEATIGKTGSNFGIAIVGFCAGFAMLIRKFLRILHFHSAYLAILVQFRRLVRLMALRFR